MPRVLGGRSGPRTSDAFPRAVIGYAVICIAATLFLIASAIING